MTLNDLQAHSFIAKPTLVFGRNAQHLNIAVTDRADRFTR